MTENFDGVGSRLREKLDELHMKQVELAIKTHLSKNALSNYMGDNRLPDTKSLYKLAKVLNVSMEWLLTGEDNYNNRELSNEELELLKMLSSLNEANLNKIIGMIELKIKEQEDRREPLYTIKDESFLYAADESNEYMHPIAILGNVAAGEPIEAIYSPDDFLMLTGTSKASFALKIRGDSMEPQIKDGSTVLVEKNSDIQNGKVAIVDIAGDVTCKKIIVANDHVELHSFNSKYNPIILTRDEVEDKGVHVIGYVLLDKDLGN